MYIDVQIYLVIYHYVSSRIDLYKMHLIKGGD